MKFVKYTIENYITLKRRLGNNYPFENKS